MKGKLTRTIYLTYLPWPIARNIYSIFEFTLFCMRTIKLSDKVLFYNHRLEYLPGLLILLARRISVLQDIEDIPDKNDFSFRNIINRISFFFFCKITDRKKIVASNGMAAQLDLTDYISLPGVANLNSSTSGTKISKPGRTSRWDSLGDGQRLNVHYGGTLKPDTGTMIFIECIQYLSTALLDVEMGINFLITGHFSEQFKDRLLQCDGSQISFQFEKTASRPKYVELMRDVHISLSLRNPSSQIAKNTFPSKSIDVAQSGIGLITTQVNDIGLIFKKEDIWLLDSYDGASLARTILVASHDHATVRKKAENAERHVKRLLSKEAVGKNLANFLFESNAQ